MRLIRSLLRLKSVSSQASASSPEFGNPVSQGIRLDGAGGAFSWSLRCSSCRTSSVFSRWRSPGPGVTMTLWKQEVPKGLECLLQFLSLTIKGMGSDSYPTMATVGRVLCCGWVEPLVESVTSLPPFSQSKGSFSVIIRSFMLLSNTDMSSWTQNNRKMRWWS